MYNFTTNFNTLKPQLNIYAHVLSFEFSVEAVFSHILNDFQ